MKIALGQIDMGFEEKERAKEICRRFIADAAQKGAELIVFPEMTLTGTTMHPQTYGESRGNSESIAFFRSEAQKRELSICFGLAVHENGVSENHCIIVDKNGKILTDYGKLHLFMGVETRRYSAGNDIKFCEIQGVPFSPFVCYDLRFPEPFLIASGRSLAIIVIANWLPGRQEQWTTLLKARAVENQCFVIGVNRCGNVKEVSYIGSSVVISPEGKTIAEAGTEQGLVIADIDPTEAAISRKNFPVKMDRRTELYDSLWKKYR